MATARADIKTEILKKALDITPQERLGDRMTANLRAWIAGEKKPTFNQLSELSRRTYIPFGYFFLNSLPDEPPELCEGRMENPSLNLMETIFHISCIQDWMEEYRTNEGYSESAAGSMKGKDIRISRETVLADTELGQGWRSVYKGPVAAFKALRRRLQENGIIVMAGGIAARNTRRRLDINEFRAFAMADRFAPAIFVNTNDNPEAALEALLHEAACIWMGEDDIFRYAEPHEGGACRGIPGMDRVFMLCLCESVCEFKTTYTEAWRIADIAPRTFDRYMAMYEKGSL
ncbi:MAG: hypothetical protein LUE27_01085 [Clostridia bacterium]|nr:hypothetical protein [Clostridia bacterium]